MKIKKNGFDLVLSENDVDWINFISFNTWGTPMLKTSRNFYRTNIRFFRREIGNEFIVKK